MQIQPYLFFEGRCEEALEFYRKALGAKTEMLMRYKEAPDAPPPGAPPPGWEGGKVTMPLGRTFFSPAFGMATDRFGVGGMVMASGDAR